MSPQGPFPFEFTPSAARLVFFVPDQKPPATSTVTDDVWTLPSPVCATTNQSCHQLVPLWPSVFENQQGLKMPSSNTSYSPSLLLGVIYTASHTMDFYGFGFRSGCSLRFTLISSSIWLINFDFLLNLQCTRISPTWIIAPIPLKIGIWRFSGRLWGSLSRALSRAGQMC
jgi:hypothetical protein